MDRGDIIQKVKHYIEKGTMTDLQAMSELAFNISMDMQDAYEKRQELIHNQELLRISKYKEYKNMNRKDGKSFTDTQAKDLAKEFAMKSINPDEYDNIYRRYKLLFDALCSRKIEVQSMNKQQYDNLPNNVKYD